MRISYAQDARLLELASQRLSVSLRGDATTISAWSDDGAELFGVVVFNNFAHPNVELSIWTRSPKWCSRRFLRACFEYAFRQCGCHRCSILVRTTNEKMIETARRLGFVREGLVREACDDGADAVLFGMLRRECAWLTHKRTSDGQKNPKRSPAA